MFSPEVTHGKRDRGSNGLSSEIQCHSMVVIGHYLSIRLCSKVLSPTFQKPLRNMSQKSDKIKIPPETILSSLLVSVVQLQNSANKKEKLM